jgi:actin beta/gamma 1
MHKVWKHLFDNELRVSPSEYKVMLSEPPRNPKAKREEMVKLMFEEFGINKVYV